MREKPDETVLNDFIATSRIVSEVSKGDPWSSRFWRTMVSMIA